MILSRKNKKDLKPSVLAKIRRRRTRMFDFGLGLVGVAMAGLSSYLPYYVYFNESEFGPPEMQFTGRIDYGEPVILEPGEETRTPLFREFAEAEQVFQNVDPIVVGSIQNDDSPIPRLRPVVRSRPPAEQLAKFSPDLIEHESMVLVFATRGRALVRDGGDILPVAVGSRLPDGSTVRSMTRKQSGWQVVTSNNHVLRQTN